MTDPHEADAAEQDITSDAEELTAEQAAGTPAAPARKETLPRLGGEDEAAREDAAAGEGGKKAKAAKRVRKTPAKAKSASASPKKRKKAPEEAGNAGDAEPQAAAEALTVEAETREAAEAVAQAPAEEPAAAETDAAEAESEAPETDLGAEMEPGGEDEGAERPAPQLQRLQKILAQAGIASRRHAEELITEGRVQVNGQTVTVLGSKADPARDHIRVDGKLLQGAERHRYFVLNKPRGYVTTVSDPEGRPTVMQFFERMGERLYPVGRLDYQSEGLLLVTNDGQLANDLTRAARGVEKIYLVKVAGQPSEEDLERLREGVAIDREKPGRGKVETAPARVRQIRKGANPWFEVVLIEGRNRELRKMFEEIGHHVEKIRRVGYGPLVLDVEPGKVRELDAGEVEALRLAAAGKLKLRRLNTRNMLPKDAGKTVEFEEENRGEFRRPRGETRGRGGDEAPRGPRREERGERPRGREGFRSDRQDRPAREERAAAGPGGFRRGGPPREERRGGDEGRGREERPAGRGFVGRGPARPFRPSADRPQADRGARFERGPQAGGGRRDPAAGGDRGFRQGGEEGRAPHRGGNARFGRPTGGRTGSPRFGKPEGGRSWDRGSRGPEGRSGGRPAAPRREPSAPPRAFSRPRGLEIQPVEPGESGRGPRAGGATRPFTTSTGKPRAGGARPGSKPGRPGGGRSFGSGARPAGGRSSGPRAGGVRPTGQSAWKPKPGGAARPASGARPGGGKSYKGKPGGGFKSRPGSKSGRGPGGRSEGRPRGGAGGRSGGKRRG